mgnify:CR=1 FL=1
MERKTIHSFPKTPAVSTCSLCEAHTVVIRRTLSASIPGTPHAHPASCAQNRVITTCPPRFCAQFGLGVSFGALLRMRGLPFKRRRRAQLRPARQRWRYKSTLPSLWWRTHRGGRPLPGHGVIVTAGRRGRGSRRRWWWLERTKAGTDWALSCCRASAWKVVLQLGSARVAVTLGQDAWKAAAEALPLLLESSQDSKKGAGLH